MNTTETPTVCKICSTCSQCDALSCNVNLTTAQHVQSSALQMSLNNTQHKLHTSQLGRGNSPSVSAGFQNRENRKGQETEWNHFWMSGRWNAARCSLVIRSKRKSYWLQTVDNNKPLLREDFFKTRQLHNVLVVSDCAVSWIQAVIAAFTNKSRGLLRINAGWYKVIGAPVRGQKGCWQKSLTTDYMAMMANTETGTDANTST